MYRGPGRSNSGRKSAGPHLLYFVGSEVDREAGNRLILEGLSESMSQLLASLEVRLPVSVLKTWSFNCSLLF